MERWVSERVGERGKFLSQDFVRRKKGKKRVTRIKKKGIKCLPRQDPYWDVNKVPLFN